MLKVCLGQRATGEPDEPVIHDIEGWILGRNHSKLPMNLVTAGFPTMSRLPNALKLPIHLQDLPDLGRCVPRG